MISGAGFNILYFFSNTVKLKWIAKGKLPLQFKKSIPLPHSNRLILQQNGNIIDDGARKWNN